METSNVLRDLPLACDHGLPLDLKEVSFFLGSERMMATARPGMAIWREKLFILMSRNATNAATFFSLPPEQVVELGTLVEL